MPQNRKDQGWERQGQQPPNPQRRRRDLSGGAVNLPNWVIDDLTRVTPKERVAGALRELGAASAALAEGKYHAALRHARKAKDLAPRDATIRETLGVAAYRIGDWKTALSELRAYRRMTGETTHMPIEMDVLRAQGRDGDVEKVWRELQDRGAKPAAYNEGRVVYGAFLIDKGNPDQALEVLGRRVPGRDATESELRRAYVAARAAAAVGDKRLARSLADAIVAADPGFPAIDQLEREIA
jgi:tetratricopeptide (TPR) repeat protein